MSELYRFRYVDPLTGKWREARYRATEEEIAARYEQWELIGAPEIRRSGNSEPFSPFVRKPDGEQNAPPWRFEPDSYGLGNVVLTASGSVLARNVAATAGPLLAAAPSLLAVIEKIANLSSDLGAREIAVRTLERYRRRVSEHGAASSLLAPRHKLFANIIECH